MLYIKIFDKDHNQLDELHEFSNLTVSNTLNGTPKCAFKIPLGSTKATKENIKMFNHIEVFENDTKIWGGLIVGIDFSEADVSLSCFGYIYLLSKRIYRQRKTYQGTYDKVIKAMLLDIENNYSTGLKIGKFETSSIETTRVVDIEDTILEKIMNYCNDMGYYFEVDYDRNINFYITKGKLKPYVLQETSEYSNIIKTPSISISGAELSNYIYGLSEIQGENEENKTITSIQLDNGSINTYGLFEGSFKANDGVVRQTTLDKQTLTELNRNNLPLTNIDIKCIDSALCPFDSVEVGDTVQLYIEKYLNFKEDVRILEIEREVVKNEYKVVVGNVIYKPNKTINKKIYTR